jgi:Tol biopolymer transport system component/DNA-binding winged helix-turn-helix (wHTH) protein
VDAATGELFKHGARIRLSGQPLRILLVLVSSPGTLITREQLREQIWSDGTFVDFEHGLNAAMNKLRRALADSAENPRYIETIPGQGYRFIGPVDKPESDLPSATPLAPAPDATVSSGRRWILVAAGIAVAMIVSFAFGWWLHRTPPLHAPTKKVVMLTTDSALSEAPAISPDGKLIAYSSDVGNEGHPDLYVKQVTGGEPVRLTTDGAGNTMPDFSPDGSRIVFRSDRNGGGIYEIPALGGLASFLAPNGQNPKYSPDGSRVAYWIGSTFVAPNVPGSGSIWVVPVSGGEPRRIAPHVASARRPIWFPSGKSLLFVGSNATTTAENANADWWIADAEGGGAKPTGAFNLLFRSISDFFPGFSMGIRGAPEPGCWRDANTLVFVARYGSKGLWTTRMSSGGRVEGDFARLTVGTGDEQEPSCAHDGSVAFSTASALMNIWSIALDLDHPRPGGEFRQVTHGTARREFASMSRDGRYVAFSSDQTGSLNIWIRDSATGRETQVHDSPLTERYPSISPSGSRVAWSNYDGEKRTVSVGAPGGPAENVCDGCLRATDWSAEEKALLVFDGAPYRIGLLDIASHQQTILLQHPAHNLLFGKFSPDYRWLVFTERLNGDHARIMLAPVNGVARAPESSWIPIADGESQADHANWSLDGKTLYFTSPRDGFECFWAQRLDEQTHRPLGEPIAVLHLHGRQVYTSLGWSAAAGRLAMVLTEATGNIGLIPGDR